MKQNTNRRTLSLALALLLCLPGFVSCSEKTGDEDKSVPDTPSVTPGSVEETEETEEDVFKGLATVDLNGMAFTFLTSNWPGEAVWDVDDISAEEYTGAVINDAVFERNLQVEARLNCKVEEANMPGKAEAENALKISGAAADNAYQIWVARLQEYLSLASDGYIMDMKEVEGIDFGNKSWVQNSIAGLSVLNHNFAVCNEMITIHKEAVSSILFNKNLAEQYQLDSLYDAVTNDRWTLDYFRSIVELCARDIDGDGEMTARDQWGFLYQRDTLDAFLAAGQGAICGKDEEDRPIYIFDSEKNIDILMAATDLMYNQSLCYNVMNAPGDFNEWMANKFMSDEAMFMWVRDVNIPQLRTMESDFGILPNPKYNETIDNYYSVVNAYTGAAICVPLIVDETVAEYLGLFIETMGMASMNTLARAYYDVLLNGIAVRDQESQQMLDIIYANTTYDPGSIGAYNNINEYIYMAMSYANNFASYNAARKKAVEKAIDTTISKIEKRY